ncbi:MAG TPA: hypothetical protein VJA46_05445 [Acidimicrobiia bacterium]|nr:hypothetical protein [Acidimicrobiia bacterium]
MLRIAAFVLLAAVDIGGGFGNASAEVISLTDESMEVEIQVEVEGTVDAVVVHFALSGEDPVTLPLVSRGGGVFGITTELKPANYQVVFETLGDVSIQSLPVAMADLGAEVTSPSGTVTSSTEGGFSSVTQGWGWLALAFGAASLAALAFWALGGGRDDQGVAPEPESDVVETLTAEPAGDDQSSIGPTPDP